MTDYMNERFIRDFNVQSVISCGVDVELAHFGQHGWSRGGGRG